MKKYLLILLCLVSALGYAQPQRFPNGIQSTGAIPYSSGKFGIGTLTPSAALDVTSTTNGLLIPRMTTTQMNAIVSPHAFEQIGNITTNTFWHYNGTVWVNDQILDPTFQSIYNAHGGIITNGTSTLDLEPNVVSVSDASASSDIQSNGFSSVEIGGTGKSAALTFSNGLQIGTNDDNTFNLKSDNLTQPVVMQAPDTGISDAVLATSASNGATTVNADVNGNLALDTLIEGSGLTIEQVLDYLAGNNNVQILTSGSIATSQGISAEGGVASPNIAIAGEFGQTGWFFAEIAGFPRATLKVGDTDVGYIQVDPGTGIFTGFGAFASVIIDSVPTGGSANAVSSNGVFDALAAKQPLDADLTAIAALITDSFGRGLLPQTSAANVRSYIGAGTLNPSDLTNYVNKTTANTYTAGAKQTFSPNATNAGLNIGSVTATPSSLSGGDIFYNSVTGNVHYYDSLISSTRTFVTLLQSQALSNKDLTSGTNTFPTFNQNTTGSAAKLTTARNINTVPFDGTADITVTAAAGTLTGATLASGVTASSLTSFGTSPSFAGTPTFASTGFTITSGSTANIIQGNGVAVAKSTVVSTTATSTITNSNTAIATGDNLVTIAGKAQGQINRMFAYVGKTANYTATYSDNFIDCTANSFTVTLPTAVGNAGQPFTIKNSASGTTITIATTSSQTIDGVTTKTINVQYSTITLASDGANWKIKSIF